MAAVTIKATRSVHSLTKASLLGKITNLAFYFNSYASGLILKVLIAILRQQ
jgi:hypothetical protein